MCLTLATGNCRQQCLVHQEAPWPSNGSLNRIPVHCLFSAACLHVLPLATPVTGPLEEGSSHVQCVAMQSEDHGQSSVLLLLWSLSLGSLCLTPAHKLSSTTAPFITHQPLLQHVLFLSSTDSWVVPLPLLPPAPPSPPNGDREAPPNV